MDKSELMFSINQEFFQNISNILKLPTPFGVMNLEKSIL